MNRKTFKTYLITGATGLVGSHLAEFLVRNGQKVRCFVRPNSDISFLNTLQVEIIQGDLTKAVSLDRAVSGVDVVFHCAAMVSDWADRDTMVRVNVGGTRNIVDACLKHKVQRFVMVSSLAVLGMDKQINANETAPYVYTGDNYNYTKIESEKLVMQMHREQNLPAVIVRPPYIYGPRDRQLLPRVVSFLKDGKFVFIGAGENPISLVYVKNLVYALCLASERDKAVGQIYHITDGQDISRREFIGTLAKKLGYAEPSKSVPVALAKIMCPVLEGINKLTRSKTPPLLNKFRMKFLDTYLTFDISKARNELGYKSEYSFDSALDETVAWFRNEEFVSAGV
ncbi:MAG: NAD-dependent epimerase/dehydratase family protein [Candidatus Auribacterota bacterium]|nr:NAD-dependent epimerase/dehydratase family protein [Candidatus Auribacterota bacterium]